MTNSEINVITVKKFSQLISMVHTLCNSDHDHNGDNFQ